MKFAVYQTSQIGGRNYNQDRVAYAYTNDALLMVLADGMGGHTYGEIAAQIAIHTFMQTFALMAQPNIPDPETFLRITMKSCHEAIIQYAKSNELAGNPGTTCVAALVQNGKVNWAHAGDSRCYLLRNREVVNVTRDHSIVQQWADWGLISKEEMKTHPDRNKITNCLGGVDDLHVEMSPYISVQSGDVLLLCSDGLWGPLSNEEIAQGLTGGDLPESIGKLIEVALLREQERADNTTVVVARLGENEEEQKTVTANCVILDYQ